MTLLASIGIALLCERCYFACSRLVQLTIHQWKKYLDLESYTTTVRTRRSSCVPHVWILNLKISRELCTVKWQRTKSLPHRENAHAGAHQGKRSDRRTSGIPGCRLRCPSGRRCRSGERGPRSSSSAEEEITDNTIDRRDCCKILCLHACTGWPTTRKHRRVSLCDIGALQMVSIMLGLARLVQRVRCRCYGTCDGRPVPGGRSRLQNKIGRLWWQVKIENRLLPEEITPLGTPCDPIHVLPTQEDTVVLW